MHAYICDFVLDVFHNAAEAGSSLINIEFFEINGFLHIKIEDNGPGMDEKSVAKALDPFYSDEKKHIHRKVGLGLPFLKQSVEQCSGLFAIRSVPGEGTAVSFGFPLDNIDTPPQGDPVELFLMVLTFNELAHVKITRKKDGQSYEIDSDELSDILGGFKTVNQKKLLKQFLESLEADI